MIPLWKGKNPIYFVLITIIPFDNLYRQAYFLMHTFLDFIEVLVPRNETDRACICALRISILPVSAMFLLEFGTVPTVVVLWFLSISN